LIYLPSFPTRRSSDLLGFVLSRACNRISFAGNSGMPEIPGGLHGSKEQDGTAEVLEGRDAGGGGRYCPTGCRSGAAVFRCIRGGDRKSTRLNSSHVSI